MAMWHVATLSLKSLGRSTKSMRSHPPTWFGRRWKTLILHQVGDLLGSDMDNHPRLSIGGGTIEVASHSLFGGETPTINRVDLSLVDISYNLSVHVSQISSAPQVSEQICTNGHQAFPTGGFWLSHCCDLLRWNLLQVTMFDDVPWVLKSNQSGIKFQDTWDFRYHLLSSNLQPEYRDCLVPEAEFPICFSSVTHKSKRTGAQLHHWNPITLKLEGKKRVVAYQDRIKRDVQEFKYDIILCKSIR